MEMLKELLEKSYDVTFRHTDLVEDSEYENNEKTVRVIIQRSGRFDFMLIPLDEFLNYTPSILNGKLRDLYKRWRENHLGLEKP